MRWYTARNALIKNWLKKKKIAETAAALELYGLVSPVTSVLTLACRAHHSPKHVTPVAIQYRMRLMNILCMNFARGSFANERVATMAVE